jgi:hypothetical protein
LNSLLANLDKQGRGEFLRKLLSNGQARRIFLQPQFTFDPVADAAVITTDGVTLSTWQRGDSRYTLDTTIASASTYPDRSRAIWQAIPVAVGAPNYKVVEEAFQLPQRGQGIAMQGTPDLEMAQPGLGSNRVHAGLADGVWRISFQDVKNGGEYPAPRSRRCAVRMPISWPKCPVCAPMRAIAPVAGGGAVSA